MKGIGYVIDAKGYLCRYVIYNNLTRGSYWTHKVVKKVTLEQEQRLYKYGYYGIKVVPCGALEDAVFNYGDLMNALVHLFDVYN